MKIINLVSRILKSNYFKKKSYKFIGFIGDHISVNILLNGMYEKNIIRHIKNEFKDGNIFLDVGQNIGNHSINLSQNFSHIIGFEPNPIAYQICKLNTEINNLNNIQSFNFGIGENDEDNVLLVYENDNIGTGSIIKEINKNDKKHSSIDVKIYNSEKALKKIFSELDHFDKKIDFIKIDTEGNELSIIKSLINTLIIHKPLIMFEVEKEIKSYDNAIEIFRILSEIGYSQYYTIDNKLNKSYVNIQHFKFKEYNAIFCC